MTALVAIERQLRTFLEWLLASLFALFFATVSLLVILRYVFNTTLIGAHEAVLVGFVFSTALGSAVAVSRGEHIAISYFVEKLSLAWQRRLEWLVLSLVALINGLMCWHSIFWIERTGQFMMPALQWPQWVAQLSIPLGCGLAILFCLCQMLALIHGRGEAVEAGGK